MHASQQVSIAVPRLRGGGAEKTTMQLARLLASENRVSRVYAGETEGAESFPELEVVDLHSPRARGAVASLLGKLKDDPASTLFMTLGYINLAPFARLSSPSRKLVLRLGNTIGPELAPLNPSARLRYRLSVQAACLAASKIIVQCNYMKEDLHKHVKVDDRKIQVIYNFLEDEIGQHLVSERSPIAAPYLFTAATMKPQKAFDTLLAAYAMARQTGVTDRKLVIAGVAEDDPEILALMRANQLSTENVICLGFVSNIYDLIAHSELCVLSSRYEGFCNFLLEAAGLGKKILATDSPGGNAELFENYRNVVSVPVDDVSRLCEGMGESRNDLAVSEAQSSLTLFRRETVFDQYRDALL
jgi:glycosyltransferase involved in cell wall biosynthesis